MIDLKQKTESRHCLVCAKCIAPNARGGLRVAFRRLGAEITAVARSNPNIVEVLFLFSAIGIGAAVMLEDLPGAEDWVRSRLGLGEGVPATVGYFAALTAASVLVLSTVAALVAVVLAQVRRGRRWQAWFYRLGYAIAPISISALLFCMCAVAFEGLEALGVPPGAVLALKTMILLGALIWSAAIVRELPVRRTTSG